MRKVLQGRRISAQASRENPGTTGPGTKRTLVCVGSGEDIREEVLPTAGM